MFNSASLTTIVLSVFALGLTLSAPVDAGGVKIDGKVKLEAGGLTIAGPGITAFLPQGQGLIIYKSDVQQSDISATLHCFRGRGILTFEDSANNMEVVIAIESIQDITVSATASVANQVRITCQSGPTACDCLWRIDGSAGGLSTF